MRWIAVIFAALIIAVIPPRSFPSGAKIEITQGQSVALALKEQHVITSAFLFTTLARFTGTDTKLKSGRYVFTTALPMPAVLWRVASGDFGTTIIKVTIPEGSTNKQISTLTGVDVGESNQGYLFPDTYFFDQFSKAEEVRGRMEGNFNSRVGTTTKDTVTMASIVEAEAATSSDRRLVAGILLKRLKIGMPLQVDVATSTYEHTDLPDAPINNPGIDSIRAVIRPTDSPYWYYLSDRDGQMHYARTFAEHKSNRERYGI